MSEIIRERKLWLVMLALESETERDSHEEIGLVDGLEALEAFVRDWSPQARRGERFDPENPHYEAFDKRGRRIPAYFWVKEMELWEPKKVARHFG